MGAADNNHPDDRTLQAYSLNMLIDSTAEAVAAHLERCMSCNRRVGELSSDARSGISGAQRGVDSHANSLNLNSPSLIGPSMVGEPALKSPPGTATLPPGLADHPDYEVIRELGQGGMGTVYLVNNRLMGRREVLKVVSARLIDRRGVRERFLGEIRNAARLHHANIVTAYSAVRLGETIGFAMEYVDGYDLSNLVKQRGPLPVTTACSFAHQAALGLQHAHENGMVHRDIKPSNLIVSRKERPLVVKVLDFGLAKVSRESPVEGGLTHQGQMLGTPEFIAPEQTLNARMADIRADIYSLGCTLYFLLTGAPPFRGESLYEILQAHHSMDAMPLNLARSDVPLGLAALVAKMMAKEPHQRFQTPREVADALVPFLKAGSQVADRVSAPNVSQGTPAGSASVPVQPARPSPAAAAPGRPEAVWESLVDTGEGPSAISNPSLLDATEGRGTSLFGTLFILASGLGIGGLGALYWVNRDSAVESNPVADIRANSTRFEAPQPKPTPSPAPPRAREQVPAEASGDAAIAKLAKAPDVRPGSRDGASNQKPISVEDSRSPTVAQGVSQAVARPIEAPPATVRPVEPRINRPGEPPSGMRIETVAMDGPLKDKNAARPAEPFWPSLAPEQLRYWRFGNIDEISIQTRGVTIRAEENGKINALVTSSDEFDKCSLTLKLALAKGSEAFLVLRAQPDPQGWRGVTLRLNEEGGKVHVGQLGRNFGVKPAINTAKNLVPDIPILIRFEITEKGATRATVAEQELPPFSYDNPPNGRREGAVGIFVKSGSVLLNMLDIE